MYSLVAAASETLGIKALAADFGVELDAWIWVDASAAIGIARRKDLGRVRHIETQSLWLQDAMHKKRLGLEKVPGKENPSDLQTKYLDAATMRKHLEKIGSEVRSGRPEAAPEHVPGQAGPECENENVDQVDCEVASGCGLGQAATELPGRGGRDSTRSTLREVRTWWRDRCNEEANGWAIEDTEVKEREVSLVGMESCMLDSLFSYANDAVCLAGGSTGLWEMQGI